MSSTNKTPNYKLSQFIGTDKPTFLGDYNNDMSIIDNALFQSSQSAEQALNDVEAVKGAQTELKTTHTETQAQVNQLKTTADSMSEDVTTAQNAANTAEQKATEAQNAATAVINSANTASANATKAKQTADANASNIAGLEERLTVIEQTPKIDALEFSMSLGGWRPNLSSGGVTNKYIFQSGGRNKIEFNVTTLQPGGELRFGDGTDSGNIIKSTGVKTFDITQPNFTIQFTQSGQSAAKAEFAVTVKKV